MAALGPLQKLNHFVDMILQEARVACVSVVASLPFVDMWKCFTFLHYFTFLLSYDYYNLKLLKLLRSGQAKSHRGELRTRPLF